MATQQLIKLQNRKEALDIGAIGLISGIHPAITKPDIRAMDDQMTRFVTAQALIDNINSVEGGINVRGILVEKDLLNGAGTAITSRDWRQPYTSNYSSATGLPSTAESIYKTSRTSDNDRKVIGMFGIRFTLPSNRQSLALMINSIVIKRGDVKTIDVMPVQALEALEDGIALFKTPVLFKRNDDLHILHVPDARHAADASKVDYLEYVGLVAEALGSTMTG